MLVDIRGDQAAAAANTQLWLFKPGSRFHPSEATANA
jgi:hypothetical protein